MSTVEHTRLLISYACGGDDYASGHAYFVMWSCAVLNVKVALRTRVSGRISDGDGIAKPTCR